MPTHRFARSVLLAALTGSFGAAPLAAQSAGTPPRPTFRTSADVVSIQTSVRDRRGRPVAGLTLADFEVRDNGEVRPILSMRADQRSPVSLAVLVDMSGSMHVGSKMQMVRQAFRSLIQNLRAGEDELAVFTFDTRLEERQPFTTALSQVEGALDALRPFGATSLYDATAAVARQLATRSAAHKALVILTDGTDTSSRLTAAEVSGLASSIDVPVYIIATMPSIDQEAMTELLERPGPSTAADLRELADWTGGRLIFARSFISTSSAATAFLAELRQQYVIAIEAASVNEWRRLEVRVKDRSAIVRARTGYFGG
jgi:VWFA-related protein